MRKISKVVAVLLTVVMIMCCAGQVYAQDEADDTQSTQVNEYPPPGRSDEQQKRNWKRGHFYT